MGAIKKDSSLRKSEKEIAAKDQSQTVLNQTVPHNAEAEQEILGAILSNNEMINRVGDFLLAEHFLIPMHQKIYAAIQKIIERGYAATPITIKTFLENDPAFKEANTTSYEYLLQLVTRSQLVTDVLSLAKAIHEHFIRRQLITIGQDVVIEAQQYDRIDISAQNCLERAEHKLFQLATQGNSDANLVSMKGAVKQSLQMINKARANQKAITGITTGFADMDHMTGGLQNSDLMIIAARPSMGKTAFATNIALNAAKAFQNEMLQVAGSKEGSVVIFSLEMSSEQLANRLLAMQTGIDSNRLRMGQINSDEFAMLSREVNELSGMPLLIDDSAAPTISAIRTRARRLKRQHNLGLIVIDYLQLIRGSASLNYNSRVQEIGEISQGLKALAKELNIPVIALSQLSRALENREDKRPQLSDLRESGNIEQDADIVMFIYREEYYLDRKIPTDHENNLDWQTKMNNARNIAEIIISKHRNGPIGSFKLHFNGHTTAFNNLK